MKIRNVAGAFVRLAVVLATFSCGPGPTLMWAKVDNRVPGSILMSFNATLDGQAVSSGAEPIECGRPAQFKAQFKLMENPEPGFVVGRIGADRAFGPEMLDVPCATEAVVVLAIGGSVDAPVVSQWQVVEIRP